MKQPLVHYKQKNKKAMKNGVDPKCRMCDQYDETVEHLVSG